MKKILDNGHIMHYNNHCSAGVAHLVERDLAKVEVASSSLVARSKKKHHPNRMVFFFCIYRPGRGANRARAKREKHAGGMFWCPRACGGPAGPPASLVARSKKKHHPNRVVFFCIYRPGRGSNRARAKREKHAGGMFWCPRACGGPAGPPASLVARSKKKHHPNRVVFLFGMLRAGPNSLPRPARSALNQEVRQGSCEWLRHSWDAGSESSLVTFFAFAVCGDADNKSSGQSKRNTIPIGWCFFAFAGPPAMCSPSCRQHKSVVFLRRFCFARKME